jgi:transposase
MCLFAKRLEADRFYWPKLMTGTVRMSAVQLAALVEGMDWTRVRSAPLTRPTSAG